MDRTFAQRHALLIVAIIPVVAQLVGSGFNIAYNLWHVQPLISGQQQVHLIRAIMVFNVIVYPTWYSGQHYDNEWLIGPGMALDPAKYFIIIPNMLGNGLSGKTAMLLAIEKHLQGVRRPRALRGWRWRGCPTRPAFRSSPCPALRRPFPPPAAPTGHRNSR